MKTLIRAAALAAMLSAGALSAHAQAPSTGADAMFRATTLSLSAYGETRIAPDMATINVGVTTQATTAVEAMQQNATRMSQVMSALTRQGIAARDIQTSSLNLSPQYDYRENQPPLLRGYQAQNQLTIRVMDVSKLGVAIDAVVSAGSNQINGISFGLKDPRAAEDAARREAVQALRAKVDLYATATGHRVLRLVNLSEGGGYSPPQPVPMLAMARAEKADTSISGGELSVRIDVNGVYELAPR